MAAITRILYAMEQGDTHAAAELLPFVYDELRRLAALQMANEKPGQTLNATALVHEAYLRLVGPADGQRWQNRGHFFAAAEAMRRILVENARRKSRKKRGGERARVDLDEAALAAPSVDDELLDLDDALTQLADADTSAAELVKLRYFAAACRYPKQQKSWGSALVRPTAFGPTLAPGCATRSATPDPLGFADFLGAISPPMAHIA